MHLSRRQFLKLTGLGVGAGLLGGQLMPGVGLASGVASAFPTPTDIGERSGNEVFFALEAKAHTVQIGGRQVQLTAYNGSFPGPTLRMREGDQVRVAFTNSLSEETNLHFHGLRVPMTQANSETPFRRAAPGETILYEFPIPAGSAGTHWYHPHAHGMVAPHLFRGLAGAIIVEGPMDAVFEGLPEQLVLLKDFTFGADGTIPEHSPMDWMMGREGDLLTVNGADLPRLEVADGVARLRLVNASNARYYRLVLPDANVTVIGTDGAYVARPYRATELLLAPGERYDVVAQFAKAGLFNLTALPYNRAPEDMVMERPETDDMAAEKGPGGTDMSGMNMGGMDMSGMGAGEMDMGADAGGTLDSSQAPDAGMDMGGMGMGGMDMSGSEGVGASTGVAEPTPLMGLSVAAPGTFRAPTDLLPIKPLSLQDASATRRIVLTEDMAELEFYIDGRTFDVDRVDFAPQLGTVEHWEIVNKTGMDHPMHLHVFPFQVYARSGVREEHLAFKDVVNVPAGESVDILVPFEDFGGRTVFHCHIVEHEDLGMMSIVEVKA